MYDYDTMQKSSAQFVEAAASARRQALRAFLVERRRAIRREDEQKVGLTQQEVARLAGISRTWYENFETGRYDRGVSQDVVEGVARALRLEGPERAKLFALAFGEGEP